MADGPSAFARGYLDHLGNVLGRIDVAAIDRVVEALLAARADDRTIFVLGNGGSAATASHLANDLAMGTQNPNRRFRTFSLVDNAALLSAAANDYGYEDVFVRQLEGILRPRDVVIAISASGSSRNAPSPTPTPPARSPSASPASTAGGCVSSSRSTCTSRRTTVSTAPPRTRTLRLRT
jgi:DNA-binding MurR/RpiR family transcriptional regulator